MSFRQFEAQLSRLPIDNYPKVLSSEINETLDIVRDLVKQHSTFTHLHKTAAQKIKLVIFVLWVI
jgi:hypothetical protein